MALLTVLAIAEILLAMASPIGANVVVTARLLVAAAATLGAVALAATAP